MAPLIKHCNGRRHSGQRQYTLHAPDVCYLRRGRQNDDDNTVVMCCQPRVNRIDIRKPVIIQVTPAIENIKLLKNEHNYT